MTIYNRRGLCGIMVTAEHCNQKVPGSRLIATTQHWPHTYPHVTNYSTVYVFCSTSSRLVNRQQPIVLKNLRSHTPTLNNIIYKQYNFNRNCMEREKRRIHLRNWYQSQLSWHNNLRSEKPFFNTRTLHQSLFSFFLLSLFYLFTFFYFFVLNFLIAG